MKKSGGFGRFLQMNHSSFRQTRSRLIISSRLFSVLALLVLLILPSYPLTWSRPRTEAGPATRPRRIVDQPQNRVPQHVPPASQTLYAPLGGLGEFGEAELVLNNNSPQRMEVTPTFYTAAGHPTVGQRLRLKPAEVRHVALAELLPDQADQDKMGGMSLTYFGGYLELGAQITLMGRGQAGSVDIPFSHERDYRSRVQEAVWWMPNHGEATIVLGNASDVPILVNLRSSTGESQETELGPFATEVFHQPSESRNGSPASSNGSVESLRLEVAGPIGRLRATGFVTSDDRSFTSTIRFYDPQAIRQPHLFATHFRVKETTPHLVLKNMTDAPISARPRFLPFSGEAGDPLELPPVLLEAQQAREVDLRPLMAAAVTRPDLEVVSVQVVNESGFNGLIGALCSTNLVTRTTYDVPLRDSGPVRNSTGSYPWRIDGDYTTLISLTNVGDKAAQFTATINYRGEHYVWNPQELAVGETAVFDVKQIRDERIPARDGYRLPRRATEGQFRWSVMGGNGTARLIGRSEVVSGSRRVSSTYSCPVCCPNSLADLLLNPGSFTGPPGGFTNIYVDGVWVDCYSSLTPRYPYPYQCDWSSQYPNVISITPGNPATATCSAPGQSQIVASTEDIVYFDDGMDCYPLLQPFSGDCMGEVVDVTINGSEGGEDIAGVSWSATVTGGTVYSYQWDFQFPGGSGGMPEVDINPQGQSYVNLTAKWFAYPASECGAEYNSTYTILLFVNFQDGTQIRKDKPLTVTLPWSKPGSTIARMTGEPAIGFDAQRNLWVVTGTGTLRKVIDRIVEIPGSSQFFNKADIHEGVHVDQFLTGLAADLFRVEDFFNLIRDLTGATEAELRSKIDQVAQQWGTDQRAEWILRQPQAEREAYAVSDQIDPRFVYQNCGRY